MRHFLFICKTATFVLCLVLCIGFLFLESLRWHSVSSREPASERLPRSFAYIENIPFSDRLNDYFLALGVKRHGAGHSGANEGLAGFNNSLLRDNSCFSELASRFTDEIKIMDFQRIAENPKSMARANLSNQLSKNSSPPAGFLWQMAMRFADNDPNLAMHLIGVCGHDDAVSIDVGLPEYNDPKVTERKKATFNDMMKAYQKLKDTNQVLMSEPEFQEMLRGFLYKPSCPMQVSVMFQPRALGEETDIPSKLKVEIASVQAPKLGMSALPAKSYHVIGGALSTCLLYQRGVPSIIASAIHERAVNAYRSSTICRIIKGEAAKGIGGIEAKEFSEELVRAFVRKVKADPTFCESSDNATEPLCAVFSSNSRYRNTEMAEDDLAQRLVSGIRRVDAAMLVTKSRHFPSLENCSKIDIQSKLESILKSVPSSQCPTNWDEKRCTSAKRVVNTWKTDFEWTRAQHMAGERFARSQCVSLDSGKGRVGHSCVALDKIRSSTASNGSAVAPTRKRQTEK